MATRLEISEFESRIDCYGEFDRNDRICLVHCSLSFECAAAREHYDALQWHDESLEFVGCLHST